MNKLQRSDLFINSGIVFFDDKGNEIPKTKDTHVSDAVCYFVPTYNDVIILRGEFGDRYYDSEYGGYGADFEIGWQVCRSAYASWAYEMREALGQAEELDATESFPLRNVPMTRNRLATYFPKYVDDWWHWSTTCEEIGASNEAIADALKSELKLVSDLISAHPELKLTPAQESDIANRFRLMCGDYDDDETDI